MGKYTIFALRAVLVVGLAGSVFVQVVMVPLLYADLDEEFNPDGADVRIAVSVIVFLGIVLTQIVMVCVWRLVSMARAGTVFSHAAFRYVDIVIGAISAASLLTFVLGVVLAPGEAEAPGVVLLIGGLAMLIAGVALVVVVMRALLAQAVAREVEAQGMRAELDEVI